MLWLVDTVRGFNKNQRSGFMLSQSEMASKMLAKDRIKANRKHIRMLRLQSIKSTRIEYILIAVFIITSALIVTSKAVAEPLGGWDTFPGPVAEPDTTQGD